MKNIKRILPILLCCLFLVGCIRGGTTLPNRAWFIPRDFAPLNEMLYGRDYIRLVFFHELVEFDFIFPDFYGNGPGTVSIFETNTRNCNFIVMRRPGEYFVNEAIMLEILEYAGNRQELVDIRYSLGEVIEIHPLGGIGETREFTIYSFEKISDIGGIATYEISFNINPPMSDLELTRRSFTHVETPEVGIVNIFDMVDIVDENTVRLRIRNDRTISALSIRNLTGGPLIFEGHRRTIDLIGQH
jgi:hypothetical protein